MKIKILYVIDSISFGGGERAFAQIIKGIDKERFEIYCACFPVGEFVEKIKNYAQIMPLNLRNRYNLFNICKLIKIMKEKNIYVVHTQGGRGDFFGRVAAGLARTPIIISSVAAPVEVYDVNLIKRAIYMILDRLSERFVDKFIVVSDTLIKRLIKAHKAASEKIIKIYNGVELEEYDYDIDIGLAVRKEFNLESNVLLVGAIGRLAWVKGLNYFIQAIKRIEDSSPEIGDKIRCLIVGEGNLRKKLEDLAKSLHIEKKIIFTGFRKDIKEILSALDIFVLSSVYEGQPIILLEAMAMAKPIVATDIPGIEETVIDGVSGMLVQPKDHLALAQAIIAFLKDKEKAQKMGLEARRIAEEKFHIEDKIRQHEQLYSDLFLEKQE
jgi:glycosyltransferase involved in cell wall biosynthesis